MKVRRIMRFHVIRLGYEPSEMGYELDTFLKELLASLVGMVSAFILGSKIRLYFEIRKSLKINILWLVQGASYI